MVDAALLNMSRTTTVLSAMRLKGSCACITYEDGMTKERFLRYLRDTLLPVLHKGDIVVMDNLRTHYCKDVAPLIRSVGAVPLHLSPYSPAFNPIEKMWSKMKAILRKQRVRIKSRLLSAVSDALKAVSPLDYNS